ncbi:MAG: histidine kinase [Pseudoclavibacter sp.]|nr:histidine kinase [Pseudoclavibacter sp.]
MRVQRSADGTAGLFAGGSGFPLLMQDLLIVLLTVLGLWAPTLLFEGFLAPGEISGAIIRHADVLVWFDGSDPQPGRRSLGWFGVGLAVLAASAAMLRRRFPVPCFLIALASTVLASAMLLTMDMGVLSGLCLIAVAERYGRRGVPWWWVALGASITLIVFAIAIQRFHDDPDRVGLHVSALRVGEITFVLMPDQLLLGSFVLALCWEIGVRSRQRREEVVRRAELSERLRLRRDVHDVLSHSLSTIGVRAGVAAQVRGLGEEELYELLADIERVSREGLAELRGILHDEGTGGGTDPAASAPFGRSLAALAERAEATGLRVELDVDAELGEADDPQLPAALRTALYRLVQEALTNTVRHADASRCSIRLRRRAEGVEVRVRDDGTGASRFVPGQGLTGMRERVRLLRGRLETDGAPPGGGFEIRAVVPLSRSGRAVGAPAEKNEKRAEG